MAATGHKVAPAGHVLRDRRSEGWWGEQDSNLRRRCHQIYSLTPLAAREPPQGDKDPSILHDALVSAVEIRRTSTPTPGAGTSASLKVDSRPQELCYRAIPCVFRCDGAIRATKVDGASDGARTHDLLITNQGLYQLSYTGLFVDCGGSRGADEAGQRERLAAVPKNSGAVC